MTTVARSLVAITLALTATVGCSKRAVSSAVEGYAVVSHDARTGEWVIIRNGTFDGKYLTKRITAVCSSYQWGDREQVEGPNACDLRVGQMIVSNWVVGEAWVDVIETSSEWLTIVKGHGSERVTQRLKILKYEVLRAAEG